MPVPRIAKSAPSIQPPKRRAEVRRGGRARLPEDPVDTILVQWQRERPDLDAAPMRLFGLLARTHFLTTSHLNRKLLRWDMSRASFDVLATLRRAGPPFSLTPKQLAKSLMLSGAGMTSRLDRLEALHLVARLPDADDRRSLKIQLTHRGVKLIDEIMPEIVKAQWRIVESFGADTTQMLIGTLSAFSSVLSEEGLE